MLNPIDHPFISLFLILCAILGISALLYYCTGNDSPYNYAYTDLDGNEGYAQWCETGDILSCYRDGGYVHVKEFHKNNKEENK